MNLESSARVIIVAPVGQDASAIAELLQRDGIATIVCVGTGEVAHALNAGAGALLITEEALNHADWAPIWHEFETQPEWSELPLIIITSGGEPRALALLEMSGAAAGGTMILERPMSTRTLLRTVQTALRARRRQYQVRDLLEKLGGSIQVAESALREAEAATRSRDDFIAALSHELRTPLSPVLMAVSALQESSEMPARAQSSLTMIRRNVELEARLIDDLLDLTHIERGKFTLNLRSCDVHELLQRSEEIVRGDMREKAQMLEIKLDAAEHWVEADPARLQQVLWNLLKNALKFTGSGGRVIVQTKNVPGNQILITVEDTGIGLTSSALKRIFQPFDQGDLHGRHQFGDWGLGLSISKAIIDAHGGELTAQSKGRGEGATFSVLLHTCPQGAVSSSVVPGDPVNEGPQLRILLVEDHEDTRKTLAALIRRKGHQVDAASSIRSALALAGEGPYDLLISDLGLPDGTGMQLMREIQSRYGFPGIAVSGYGMPSDIRESKAAGFDYHLVKPINIAALRGIIAEIAVVRGQVEKACSAG